ncbi:MAG: glycosyltransferase family 4 protein [Actinomycetota bacterium]
MTPYLVAGLIALTITFVATPLVRSGARRCGLIDRPGDRKIHALPTPTLGGLAIFLGVLGAGLIAYLYMPDFREGLRLTSEPLGIAAGAIVIFALGAVDDVRELPAPVKLAGQIFASGLVFLAGVKMEYLLLPGNQQSIVLSDDVSVLVTIAWLVAMINALNLVDGLDGLAAGIAAIASAAFFVYSFQLSDAFASTFVAPLAAIIILGASLGFLRYNFHPASIFMGDSGAMLLGLLLGAATVVAVGAAPPAGAVTTTSEVFLAYFPLLIPLMVLALPLLDALFAIVRRARRRRSVFIADKEHIHHRLMDLGHGHRQAVIVMYVWSALAAGAALAYSFLDQEDLIYALPIAVGALVLYTLFPLLTKVINERISP